MLNSLASDAKNDADNAVLNSFGYSVGFNEDNVDETNVEISEDCIYVFIDLDGAKESIEINLETKMEVCGYCEGKGKHTNPAIDGNGITASEMDELGEEFFQDYMSGIYDVTCYECKGKRVISIFDENSLSNCSTQYRQAVKLYYEYLENEADSRAERAYEIRMGC